MRKRLAGTTLTLATLTLTATLALAACGGSDDGDGGGGGDGPSSPAGEAADGSGDAGADDAPVTSACPATAVTFTNLETGASGSLTAAIAKADVLGSAYLGYVADFGIGASEVTSFWPDVPAGNHVFVVQMTTLSGDPAPIETGSELTWDTGGTTFLVSHVTDTDRFDTALADDTNGSLTVTAATDDELCFEFDYRSNLVEVSGIVAAPIAR